MSSRGGTAEDPSAVRVPHESSLDRKSADSSMRLVIQPTSVQQSARAVNPDLKTSVLVSCHSCHLLPVSCHSLGRLLLLPFFAVHRVRNKNTVRHELFALAFVYLL